MGSIFIGRKVLELEMKMFQPFGIDGGVGAEFFQDALFVTIKIELTYMIFRFSGNLVKLE